MKQMSRILLVGIVMAWGWPSLAAAAGYNVALSTTYAHTWYLTTLNNWPFVDHVNSALATPPGPYTWYYLSDPETGATASNDGDGHISVADGEDCTNFGSQELKAGGVVVTASKAGFKDIKTTKKVGVIR